MKRSGQVWSTLWRIVIAMLVAACSTVSYDQQADQQISNITSEINLQLITWKHQAESIPSQTVAYDQKFYDKAQADISVLQIRMEASQDAATEKLQPIFPSLISQLEEMRKLHEKQNNLSAVFLQAELDLLNVQLASLTTFEISLKGTQSSGTSSATTDSVSTKGASSKASSSNATQTVKMATGATN